MSLMALSPQFGARRKKNQSGIAEQITVTGCGAPLYREVKYRELIHTPCICMEMKLLDKIVVFFGISWLTVINPGSQTHKPYWVLRGVKNGLLFLPL